DAGEDRLAAAASAARPRQHRTGPAIPLVAALLASGELELIAQRLEKGALHWHGKGVLLPVHQQADERLAKGPGRHAPDLGHRPAGHKRLAPRPRTGRRGARTAVRCLIRSAVRPAPRTRPRGRGERNRPRSRLERWEASPRWSASDAAGGRYP